VSEKTELLGHAVVVETAREAREHPEGFRGDHNACIF